MLDCQRRQPGIIDIISRQFQIVDESTEDTSMPGTGRKAASALVSPEVILPIPEDFRHRHEVQPGQSWNSQQRHFHQFAEAEFPSRLCQPNEPITTWLVVIGIRAQGVNEDIHIR